MCQFGVVRTCISLVLSGKQVIIKIITYIYHALIKVLSAHMIHINLNTIFYTHVEQSPTKTIYLKIIYGNTYTYARTHTRTHAHTHTHTHTHTHARTRTHTHARTHALTHTHTLTVAKLGIDINWGGNTVRRGRFSVWAVSKVLWEWIPNVGSKAIQGAKAISLAFVLLDFQQKSVVYETECRHVAVQRDKQDQNHL